MKKVIVSLLLIPGMASAEFLTGNDLLSRMNSDEVVQRMFALGYVAGVSDAQQHVFSCPPAGVTNGQVRDVAKSYIEANPGIRHKSADMLVTDALKQVWPCANRNKGNGTRL
jgi:hypothetical protein